MTPSLDYPLTVDGLTAGMHCALDLIEAMARPVEQDGESPSAESILLGGELVVVALGLGSICTALLLEWPGDVPTVVADLRAAIPAMAESYLELQAEEVDLPGAVEQDDQPASEPA